MPEIKGQLPREALKKVFEWMDLHHDELMANWARLQFSNGERRIVDFRPLLVGNLREQLLEHDKFVQYALTDWTLEWNNSVDFAPENLYEVGKAA